MRIHLYLVCSFALFLLCTRHLVVRQFDGFKVSEVLAYDFLREVYLADEPRRYSITIEADKEDIEEIRKWLLEKRRE